jgi:hypothetical protein
VRRVVEAAARPRGPLRVGCAPPFGTRLVTGRDQRWSFVVCRIRGYGKRMCASPHSLLCGMRPAIRVWLPAAKATSDRLVCEKATVCDRFICVRRLRASISIGRENDRRQPSVVFASASRLPYWRPTTDAVV